MGDDSEYPRAWLLEQPEIAVAPQDCKALGVLAWRIDADNYEQEGKLARIRKERDYKNHDFVESVKIPNLKEKLTTFKTEHLHYDEEIRFMVDGSGYFDIKNVDDVWVRIQTVKGCLIVLPAGAYHRFVPDENVFFYTMRLFQDEPVWTAHNRGTEAADNSPARASYMEKFLQPLLDQQNAKKQKSE